VRKGVREGEGKGGGVKGRKKEVTGRVENKRGKIVS